MEEWTEYVGERPLDLVTLDVYPWGTSSFTRYEDDGESLDYRTGEFCLTRYECEEAGGSVTLTIGARSGTFTPPARDYRIVVHNRSAAPAGVDVGGAPLPETTPEDLATGGRGWVWDAAAGILSARFPDTGEEMQVEVR